jgi:hypothetical protein
MTVCTIFESLPFRRLFLGKSAAPYIGQYLAHGCHYLPVRRPKQINEDVALAARKFLTRAVLRSNDALFFEPPQCLGSRSSGFLKPPGGSRHREPGNAFQRSIHAARRDRRSNDSLWGARNQSVNLSRRVDRGQLDHGSWYTDACRRYSSVGARGPNPSIKFQESAAAYANRAALPCGRSASL